MRCPGRRWAARLTTLLLLGGAMVALLPGLAQAHPLGNVTVNHYDGIELFPDHIELLAVVDYAEIPTLQQRARLDADGPERRAAAECAAVAAGVVVTVDSTPVVWTVRASALALVPGEAGLDTTRVECRFTAAAALGHPAAVEITDGHLADRIGWREITATGAGVRVVGSPVPAASVSDQLRSYPRDLLADPLDVRTAAFRVEPGAGGGAAGPELPTVSPIDQALGRLTAFFTGLVGRAELTPLVGLLAVGLAMVLGASHALLPGHGKTVMAAYLAGRRGTRRDALLVGATVTVTHTAGVLVLGLLVSLSATFAPDGVLRWLGVVSGLLVAGVGVTLLRSAWRGRSAPDAEVLPTAGHGHGHGVVLLTRTELRRRGRFGAVVGLGVAGGLVPSPTALIVLLGAVGLGRTWFGIGLVLAYGFGMAATLTAAGLLLVGLRDRLDSIQVSAVLHRRTAWLVGAMPVLTALLVLVVGVGLAVRTLG